MSEQNLNPLAKAAQAHPPLSLYIHIPWCVEKCPYCDFNSHKQPPIIPETAYVERLLADLRHDLKHFFAEKNTAQRPLHSIFIGGGTPSLFSSAAIKALLAGIRQLVDFEPNIEITLEANPGTFEVEKFAGFVDAGVNRLSIGVQSLNATHLKTLGRIHNPDEALRAAEFAAKLPLKSYNLDIMHGLPQQTQTEALADLEQVIALGAPHISWYQLTIEPNTLFASRPPQLPHEDILWNIYEQGHQKLAAAGYTQYEVSAYGREGHRGQHNINYWRFGDYLGIGCGAHGKITDFNEQGELTLFRTEKVKHPKGYLDETRSQLNKKWEIDADERLFEFFMNHLRLFETIPKSLFTARTGLNPERANPIFERSYRLKLIENSPTYWQTTAKGRLYLNQILTDLLDA